MKTARIGHCQASSMSQGGTHESKSKMDYKRERAQREVFASSPGSTGSEPRKTSSCVVRRVVNCSVSSPLFTVQTA